MVTDGKDKLLWVNPINIKDINRLELLIPKAKHIRTAEEVLQMTVDIE